MSKIAVCDDREEERAALGAMLREYSGSCPGLSISVFSSGQQLLLSEGGKRFRSIHSGCDHAGNVRH